MSEENISFDSLLDELENNINSVSKGGYDIKALNLKQQRKILNTSYDAVEIPAKLSNIYNDFIRENVMVKDNMLSSDKIITVAQKSLLLVEIRKITLGDTFTNNKVEYKFNNIKTTELNKKYNLPKITFGKFTINLKIPTLYEDTQVNSQLIVAIQPFKKKKAQDIELGPLTDMYQIYELQKFIDDITFANTTYKFSEISNNDKMKFMNLLPPSIAHKIQEFITKIKSIDEVAFKGVSKEGEIAYIDINSLFFATNEVDDEEDE